MVCAQCHTELLPGKPFCHACGAPASMSCPSCGARLESRFRFCPDCGHSMTDARPAPPGAPETPPADDRFARLSQHIPSGLVNKIRSSRSSITGERKLVTVLFCDLVGSTAIAEMMDPEEYRELLEQYLELAFAEIYRVEGIVNQLAGDGMMALFGAPVAHENAPQRALHAALAIREALDAFNKRRGAEGENELQVRIGINTGPVVVGTVGNDLKMDYTAIGDTTNLASRLQSMAEPGQILVSESTRRLVRGFFQLRKSGSFDVRGKTARVTTYEVLGVSDAVTPMAVAEARGLTPLAGRAGELSQLRSCYERLPGNLAQVVAMIGEAGSGKSRLIYEFKQEIANDDVVFFESRCAPLTQMAAYAPWMDMLRAYFDLKRGDPPEVSCGKISSRLEDLGLMSDQVFPYLCRKLALPADGLSELSPEELQRRTFHAMGTLIMTVSRRQPAVIIIEDLQWIDDSSLEMLQLMLSKLKSARVMVILTHRPDYQAAWRTHAALTQLILAPLGEEESREMIRSIAGGELPAELEKRILARAEGYPFFTEELTRSLVEDGYLVPGNGSVSLTRPVGEIQIPDTVQDLVGARLDRLGPRPKRVVQVAAVIGRQFSPRYLVGLLEGEEIDVPRALEELEGLGVVHRKNMLANEEYRFGESLTQEVAYESLLLRERRHLHDRVGQVLEAAADGPDAEGMALIAHHYARGENREKAVEAMLRAGREAEAVPSYNAAVRFFREAWELAEEILKEGEQTRERRYWAMQAALGQVRMRVLHGISGSGGEIQALARRGLALAEELGDQETVAAFYSFMGMDGMARNRDGFAEGLSLIEKGHEIAMAGNATLMRVRSARGVSWAYLLDGRFKKSKSTMRWAMEELENAGGLEKYSDLYISMGWMQGAIDFFSDDVETAEKRLRHNYELALRAPNYTVQASSAVTISQVHFQRAEYDKAREWAKRSLEVAREIGHHAPIWSSSVILFATDIETGKTGSVAEYVKTLEEALIGGTNILLSIQYIVEALIAAGEVESARRYAELAHERAGGRLREAYAAAALGEVQGALGKDRWEDAGASYARAMALAEEVGSRSVASVAKLGAARLARAKGDESGGLGLAREALEISRQIGNVRGERRAESFLNAAGAAGRP